MIRTKLWMVAGLLIFGIFVFVSALWLLKPSATELVIEKGPDGKFYARHNSVDALKEIRGRDKGLRHIRWTRRYMGGASESVGITEFVDIDVDGKEPFCTGQILIREALLKDTGQGLGKLLNNKIAVGLKRKDWGRLSWGLGEYDRSRLRRIDVFNLQESRRWFRKHNKNIKAVEGLFVLKIEVEFSRVDFILEVALSIQNKANRLNVSSFVSIEPVFESSLMRWFSSKVQIGKVLTRFAGPLVEKSTAMALALERDIALQPDYSIKLKPCVKPVDFSDEEFVVFNFAMESSGVWGEYKGEQETSWPGRGTIEEDVALLLHPNGMDSLLGHLWRSGLLESSINELAKEHLVKRPEWGRLLDLDIQELNLRLPPVFSHDEEGRGALHVASDVLLRDGDSESKAELYAELGLDFNGTMENVLTMKTATLSCQDGASMRRPCFQMIFGEVVRLFNAKGNVLAMLFQSEINKIVKAYRFGEEGFGWFQVGEDMSYRLQHGALLVGGGGEWSE